MNTLINKELRDSLSPQPIVRINTEVNSLKDWDLLNTVQGDAKYERVFAYAWNKTRLLMEYKNKRHIDPGSLNRSIMRTFKGDFPYRNPLTPYFFKNESNRTT